MDYQETLAYLESLEPREWKLDLKPVLKLLERLGSPHKGLKCIHVAGTNGKGSVCAMLAAVLKEAGYKVGMYISPHLERFTERYTINGKEISEKKIVELTERVKRYYTDESHFEFTTAMAFLYFKEENVDFVVLEVGLGGRLDATNVVDPLVSVITDIGLEHTKYLGDTLGKIAFEKAGIIKQGRPVVTNNEGDALAVIKKVSEERNAPLYLTKKAVKENGAISVDGHKNLKLGLKGDFQLRNASLAVKTMDVLNENYNLSISEEALKKGLEKAKWPGRFEFVRKNILLDCAHNPHGMNVLTHELKGLKFNRLVAVVGILKDKNYKEMVSLLEPYVSHFIFTTPNSDRALDPKELANHTKKPYEVIENIERAVEKGKSLLGKNDLLLICGSIYMVGEARKHELR